MSVMAVLIGWSLRPKHWTGMVLADVGEDLLIGAFAK